MPKEFFSADRVTSLHSLPPASKIHVIGVCGVAMAQISIALAERGFQVTGSDREFYEPMRSLLASSPVKTKTGYAADNVPLDAALVVIGNSVGYANPEVEVVERSNLPYTCFPKILQEVAISGKHSIVITGTHGKSTTTAIVATLLIQQGKEPSYFVGGVAQGLPQSLAVGTGKFSVVEGDEYDSAFFAKVPKFSFYTPDTVVVNAIEYDHADIYPNLEAIEAQFTKLVCDLPKSSTAICCIDFPRVKALVEEWKTKSPCRIVTFGRDVDADFRILERTPRGLSQDVRVSGPGMSELTYSIPMVGEYNARNSLASLIVANVVGLDIARTVESLGSFAKVKRRQEVRCQKGGVLLLEDFAHHPTAALETVEAVREAFPDAKMWAVFEPRSNTSRRKVFQNDYVKAFAKADNVILKHVVARGPVDVGVELLDVEELSAKISESGVPSRCLPDVNAISEYLWTNITISPSESGVNDVVVVMSNGSFDGLNDILQGQLESR